jgi:hypothetical protein
VRFLLLEEPLRPRWAKLPLESYMLATGAKEPPVPVTGGVKAVVKAESGIGLRPIAFG